MLIPCTSLRVKFRKVLFDALLCRSGVTFDAVRDADIDKARVGISVCVSISERFMYI